MSVLDELEKYGTPAEEIALLNYKLDALREELKIAEEKGAWSMLKYVTSHYAVNKIASDEAVFKFWKDGK